MRWSSSWNASNPTPLQDAAVMAQVLVPLRKDNGIVVNCMGFALVPDFGGTAHAYCGDTLAACIGDVMKGKCPPTMDQALRAYIIKSRVRDGDKLLLAAALQPYAAPTRSSTSTGNPTEGMVEDKKEETQPSGDRREQKHTRKTHMQARHRLRKDFV